MTASKRIEQRYIVPEQTALELRDYIQGHLNLDEHCHGKENFSYAVHDIYLDSDTLRLYWSVINGDENQVRLRLRSYGDDPGTPVFLETKQVLKDFLTKERVAVRRAAAALIIGENDPDPTFLISRTRDDTLALERFGKMIKNLNAKPKIRVAFNREAYRTSGATLTFDRLVRTEPAPSIEIRSDISHPIVVWGNDIVLEMKYIDRPPKVFGRMERDFGLRLAGVEKYVDSVALMGESRLRT